MQMEMIFHARSRDFAEVHSDIESFGIVLFLQGFKGFLQIFHLVVEYFFTGEFGGSYVFQGSDHDMGVVVWVSIEEKHIEGRAGDDELLGIRLGVPRETKNAIFVLGGDDVFESPWRP